MKRLIIWLKANFSNAKLWRVQYHDGRGTRLLSKSEAKSLAGIFGGRLWIDYGDFK